MKNNSIENLVREIGIEELFGVLHGSLQGSTILALNRKEYLTVSQMLSSIEYLIKFITGTFDMSKDRYSITVKFLRTMQLVLTNKSARKPTKEQMNTITDVMHEMADMHARNEAEKEKNEKIALAIKYLIKILK